MVARKTGGSETPPLRRRERTAGWVWFDTDRPKTSGRLTTNGVGGARWLRGGPSPQPSPTGDPLRNPGMVARKTLTPTLSHGEREQERPHLRGRGSVLQRSPREREEEWPQLKARGAFCKDLRRNAWGVRGSGRFETGPYARAGGGGARGRRSGTGVAGCAGSEHGAGSRPRTPGWRRGRRRAGLRRRPYARFRVFLAG